MRVAYESWSITTDSDYSNFTREILVFCKSGRNEQFIMIYVLSLVVFLSLTDRARDKLSAPGARTSSIFAYMGAADVWNPDPR